MLQTGTGDRALVQQSVGTPAASDGADSASGGKTAEDEQLQPASSAVTAAARGIDLSMGITDWLAMHGASDCEESFRAEDVETAEDVTFLVSHEDDLAHMGLEPHQVAKLWPAVQQRSRSAPSPPTWWSSLPATSICTWSGPKRAGIGCGTT